MTEQWIKLHILSNYNEIYTPPEAVKMIIPYLPIDYKYWEMCYWEWHFAKELIKKWFNVIWNKDWDCFDINPECDCIITNPPFKWNIKFIKRAIELKKPFVFLLRLEHLWWVWPYETFKDLDIEILIQKKWLIQL